MTMLMLLVVLTSFCLIPIIVICMLTIKYIDNYWEKELEKDKNK